MVRDRALGELDVGNSFCVASGPALLSASPVDNLFVALVADVRISVDD